MSQEKIWLKNYPDGIPDELEFDPAKTLVTILDDAESEFPEGITGFRLSISSK